MSLDLQSGAQLQNHVIKITALITAVACGTYVFWHAFLKDRPGHLERARMRQQSRRQRRLYRNDRSFRLDHSDMAIAILRSDEYIAIPHTPQIERTVRPVLSSVSRLQLVRSTSANDKQLTSTSRDLSPGKKRPITSTVAGKYHKTMPADSSSKPPPGYAPVYTNQGRVIWQRLPNGYDRVTPWILQVPFIRNWNNTRRQLHDRFPFMFMPIHNLNLRLSDGSLDVNLDQEDEDPLADANLDLDDQNINEIDFDRINEEVEEAMDDIIAQIEQDNAVPLPPPP